jgi:hypothetical protein
VKEAETKGWVLAAKVAVAAVLVGLLLAGVFGGLLPPE